MTNPYSNTFNRSTAAIGAVLAIATDPATLAEVPVTYRGELRNLLRRALEKLEPAPDPATTALAAWEVETFGAVVSGTEPEPTPAPAPVFAVRELADGRFSVTRDGKEECRVHSTRRGAEAHLSLAERRGPGECVWQPLSPGKEEPAPEPETPPRFVVIEHPTPTRADRFAIKDTATRTYEEFRYGTRGYAQGWAERFESGEQSVEDYGWLPLPGEEPEPEDLTARYSLLIARDGRPAIVDNAEKRAAIYREGDLDRAQAGLEAIRGGRRSRDWVWTDGIPEPRYEVVEFDRFAGGILSRAERFEVVDHKEREAFALYFSTWANAEAFVGSLTTLGREAATSPGGSPWSAKTGLYERIVKATRPRFEVVTFPDAFNGHSRAGIADHELRTVAAYGSLRGDGSLVTATMGVDLGAIAAKLNAGEAYTQAWTARYYRDDLTVVPAA
jgi:hypothetical protein